MLFKRFAFGLFFLAGTVHAAEMTGYVMDKQCLSICTGLPADAPCTPDGINSFYHPEKHNGWCLLLSVCVESGYVLMSPEPGEDGMHSILLDFAGEESQANILAFIQDGTAGFFPRITVEYDETLAEEIDGVIHAQNAIVKDPWEGTSNFDGADTHQVLCPDSSSPDVFTNNLCMRSDILVTETSDMYTIESNGCPGHPNMMGSSGKIVNSQPEPSPGAPVSESDSQGACGSCGACGAGCDACSAGCGACGAACGACSAGCGACSAGCDACSAGCGASSAGCDACSAGCGACSAGCDACSAGCGACSAGCDACSAGCGACSAGCDSCSAGCGACSAGCDACSAGCGACGAGCAACSAGCGACSAGCDACSAGCDACGAGCDACSAGCGACAAGCGACGAGCGACAAGCGACAAGCGACGADCGACSAGCGACGGCGGSNKPNTSNGSETYIYEPRYQHYTMTIPVNPGEPGEAEYFSRDDVVGIMVNGVVLDSHKATWSYDNCNGHSDTKHQYHYHIPPKCLLDAMGVPTPDSARWWINDTGDDVRPYEDMAEQFLATAESGSPIIGFARDGYPIFGPYDENGQLQRGTEYGGDLDECNGKVDSNGNYGYYLTVDPPFAPPCLRGEKGLFTYHSTAMACPILGVKTTIVEPSSVATLCEMTSFSDVGDCVTAGTFTSSQSSAPDGPAGATVAALAAGTVAVLWQLQ